MTAKNFSATKSEGHKNSKGLIKNAPRTQKLGCKLVEH